MQINRVIWNEEIIEKLASKHGVTTEEVEALFESEPRLRRGPKGKRKGEDLYYAFGQTEAGRYLFVVFILKPQRMALIISARDMTDSERRWYRGK